MVTTRLGLSVVSTAWISRKEVLFPVHAGNFPSFIRRTQGDSTFGPQLAAIKRVCGHGTNLFLAMTPQPPFRLRTTALQRQHIISLPSLRLVELLRRLLKPATIRSGRRHRSWPRQIRDFSLPGGLVM